MAAADLVDVINCACCHRAPASNEVFLSCARCVEQKLKPAKYCSKACQKEDWPAHKRWHQGVAELLATQAVRVSGGNGGGDDGPEKAAARHAEYSALVQSGLKSCAAGKRAEGIAAFEKAIALRPEQPIGFANLGYTRRDNGEFDAALPPLLRAIALFEDGSEQWATCIAVAWFAYSADPILCNEVPNLPPWLTELAPRLTLADKCVVAAPSSFQCWAMLGMGLAEAADEAPSEQREAHLSRAAQCFRRASKLTDVDATKKGYLEFARALLGRVKDLKQARLAAAGGGDATAGAAADATATPPAKQLELPAKEPPPAPELPADGAAERLAEVAIS